MDSLRLLRLVFSGMCFVALALASPAEEPVPPSSDPVLPVPRDRDYSWMPLAEWNQKHADFSAIAAAGEVELVFMGDSIIAGAQWCEVWKKAFGGYKSANFGMGGDRTQNLLWRLDNGEIGALKPKVVVLLIGTNNIHTTSRDVADTTRGIVAIVEKLHAALPATKILVLGVFPRGEKPDAVERPKIVKINEALAKLHDGQSIFVLDLAKALLEPDGTLPRSVSPDQIHLTDEGVRRWVEAMAPTVQQLMQ